jgi:hypothetical protein
MEQESLAQIHQRISAAADALRGELAESKPHSGVLAEALRQELRLVAEDQSFLKEQFRETRALIQLS